MLNALRPALTRVLTPVADALARTPVTPNAITITGTVGVVAGALWLFPTGHLFAGTMVCTGFVLADMLDGLLARVKGTTGAWGAFLDSTLDRIGDAAVFAGLTIWLVRTGQQGLAWVALFCLVAGTHRAAADYPGRCRVDRAGRALRARDRPVGARRPVRGDLRAAGGCGAPRGRRPAGTPRAGREAGAGPWWRTGCPSAVMNTGAP
jgi:hypothetical protein